LPVFFFLFLPLPLRRFNSASSAALVAAFAATAAFQAAVATASWSTYGCERNATMAGFASPMALTWIWVTTSNTASRGGDGPRRSNTVASANSISGDKNTRLPQVGLVQVMPATVPTRPWNTMRGDMMRTGS
jgi:hypothetical protein